MGLEESGAGMAYRTAGLQVCRSAGRQVWWVCDASITMEHLRPMTTYRQASAAAAASSPPPKGPQGPQGPQGPSLDNALRCGGGHAQALPPAMFDGAQPGGMMGIWLPVKLRRRHSFRPDAIRRLAKSTFPQRAVCSDVIM